MRTGIRETAQSGTVGYRAPDGIRRWQTTGVPNAGVTRYKGWPRPQTGFTPQVRVYSRAAREKWIQFRNIPDNASPLEYVASLKKLAALDWDRMIPGHPYAGGRYGTKKDVQDDITCKNSARFSALSAPTWSM